MPERTHPTQQDEALRQAKAERTARTLVGLRCVARILNQQPNAPMTDDLRIHAPNQHVRYLRSVYRDPRTAGVTLWDIVDALPPLHDGDTRGEYATRILLTVAQVTA